MGQLHFFRKFYFSGYFRVHEKSCKCSEESFGLENQVKSQVEIVSGDFVDKNLMILRSILRICIKHLLLFIDFRSLILVI